ncbi:hypothetical protein ACR78Z_17835 [Sphingobacterium thalpophilum]|uniref:hypothetical protein n=1 Tax=Sphingobacterium thalpophilum TaxID=259 RepID=UPI003DA2D60A
MLSHLERNLSESDKFIIIGYGCLDSGINRIIDEKLKTGVPIYVVDPGPSPAVSDFVAQKGAKLIKKTPEEIMLEDFDEN